MEQKLLVSHFVEINDEVDDLRYFIIFKYKFV